MKKIFIKPITFLFLLLSISACEKTLIGPAAPNNPEQNFDTLWQEYDRLSAFIAVKNIDWNALYAQYRPQVKPTTTDEELFKIISEMLDHFDDSHLTMMAPGKNPMRYDGGLSGKLTREDFSLKVVKEQYLTETATYGDNITYGKLSPRIGYIHISHLDYGVAYYEKAMNKILNELKDTEGLVLDIRELLGGLDRNSAYVAGRFATEKKLFMTSTQRNGPKHTDFTAPIKWYVQPEGKSQFTKPVVVLTNRWTASSGETFLWALKQTNHVVQIGDTTQGCYSDQARRELPNGWYYSISINDMRAADGKSYEGIGIAPDILVKNTKAEVLSGKDRTLERAVEEFRFL